MRWFGIWAWRGRPSPDRAARLHAQPACQNRILPWLPPGEAARLLAACRRLNQSGSVRVLGGPLLFRRRFLLLLLLVRHVMAHDAPRGSAWGGVMMNEMPRHSANHGALDAAFGLGCRVSN